jgi:hypothetical protein
MRNKKAKKLRKEWLELNQKPQYNIKGQVVEGIPFRRYKKNYAGNYSQKVNKASA